MHFFFLVPEATETCISKIDELEESINKKYTPDKLRLIMESYKNAIERFSDLEDPRAEYLQRRLKKFLSQPHIQSFVSPPIPKKNSVEVLKDLSTERSANKAIGMHLAETQFAIEAAQKNLKAQTDSLNLRALKRKRNTQGFENFEKELEKIVERYAEEKEKIIQLGMNSKHAMHQLELRKKNEISAIRKSFLNN
jgi:hypothetical protein